MNTAPELFRRHRINVADYFRMGEAGILAQDARVELINGEIIDMPPIGWNHANAVNVFTKALITAAGNHAVVSVQNPVILGKDSAPQPDFCVLGWPEGVHPSSHPQADDVWLAVEVADSSLAYDRTVKAELYARFGIVEFWIFNVNSRQLTRYSDVVGGCYSCEEVLSIGEPLALLAAPHIQVNLHALIQPCFSE